ncbi:MAG: DUF1801 domain-containing protein [bacterium]|nr:DUF1801 domain-containing protein [bacterium]
MPPAKPRNLAEYLARLPDDKRAALEKLRSRMLVAAPGAEDSISYGMPALSLEGRTLVCYAAARDHCSLYPMSPQVIEDLADELAGYSTSKGTIRFDPAKPMPAALVKRIVKARIAENRAKGKPRGRS